MPSKKNKENISLRNKVAIVTGAGSGIGKAVALSLVEEGFNVYLIGRSRDKLLKTNKIICEDKKTYIGDSHPFKCDVSTEKDVKKLFLEVKKKYNRLDLLFNNAGIGISPTSIDNINYKDWKQVIDININGMFLCAKYAYKTMKEQKPKGGRIINNGSISAYTPRPKTAAYTTSKHAITGLTKSISLDGRKDKIVCSQIDIGNALTPLTKSFTKGVMQSNGRKLVEQTMKVADVAKLVLLIVKMPLDTNILNTTIMANEMPYVGRG